MEQLPVPPQPLRAHPPPFEELTITAFPPTEWNVYTNCYTETKHRCIGRVTYSVRDPIADTLTKHVYSIVHIEKRSNIGLYSSYHSRILIGELVDDDTEIELFFKNGTNQNHLWCWNCWKDDMYGNDTGGVRIPHHFFASYMARLSNMSPCEGCGNTFRVFDAADSLEEGESYVFKSVKSTELKAAVEAFYIQRGGPATAIYVRSVHDTFTTEEKEELVTEAMAPHRVEKLIKEHGISIMSQIF